MNDPQWPPVETPRTLRLYWEEWDRDHWRPHDVLLEMLPSAAAKLDANAMVRERTGLTEGYGRASLTPTVPLTQPFPVRGPFDDMPLATRCHT